MVDEMIDQLAEPQRGSTAFLVERIRHEIRSGKLRKGERLPPLRKLGEQYGVSFGAVTTALGQLQWEGLITKRVGSGTYVTFDAMRDRGESVAPVHVWLQLRTHVYQELADELLGLLQKSQIEARTAVWRADAGTEQVDELMRGWNTRPPRALVTRWEFPAVVEALRRGLPSGTRVIATFGDPRFMPGGWHSVNPDRPAMCRLAVDHLVQRGHQRIGFVTYSRAGRPPELRPAHSREGEWHSLQISALKSAMQEKGLSHDLATHYLQWGRDGAGHVGPDPMGKANQDRMVRWLSGSQRPTAVVGDDARVMGVKQAAERLGLRIPQDLELVGFGDTPWSQVGNFSTISYSVPQIAREIVKLVEATPEELGSTTRHVTVPPELIVR